MWCLSMRRRNPASRKKNFFVFLCIYFFSEDVLLPPQFFWLICGSWWKRFEQWAKFRQKTSDWIDNQRKSLRPSEQRGVTRTRRNDLSWFLIFYSGQNSSSASFSCRWKNPQTVGVSCWFHTGPSRCRRRFISRRLSSDFPVSFPGSISSTHKPVDGCF